MGVNFTSEQQKVIRLRDRNILVSAAAGSGKTAVLVERIISRLTKDERPLNVDELLIVTFTEAAAAEMKERIHNAIEKALDEEPENLHLQRQATLIHQAQITTIHKFCLSVIRDYFHTIDLDPGFRVGEEGELRLLKRDVAEAVLEAAYEKSSPEFLRFVESFAAGRDDRKLEELMLQLYEFSESYPNPSKWLDSCKEQYDIHSVEELEQKPFVADIVAELRQYLEDIRELLEFGMKICEEEDGPFVYKEALQSDLQCVSALQAARTFSELQDRFCDIRWEKLKSCRDKMVSEKKIRDVKEIRDEVKGLIKNIAGRYFYDDVRELQREMLASKENMQTLTELVKSFADMFSAEKKKKNIIDFNDMEQYALQILTREADGAFVPSDVADIYQEKFAEVMIDEYQDSNLVQEAILTSVSRVSKGIYNIFMVGDVKQSIYRFRLSRPELFMEKFHTYSLAESERQRIDLHKNFRSRREVLDSANFVFEQIMIPQFGGIVYDDSAALCAGADYEEQEGNETEVILLDAPQSSAQERLQLEAESVAKRIRSLMISHRVFDRQTDSYRKVKYSDIVVLARSLKNTAEIFSEVLGNHGIPTYTASKEGYFQTGEIQLILQYLKVLDNPRQDIPLAAVLSSMFGGFTSEELGKIQCSASAKTLYERLLLYRDSGEDGDIKSRLDSFFETYEHFRRQVPYTAIHLLLWRILEESGYMDYASALPGGQQRAANLNMLVEKAVAFESTSYKGLFNFIRYIEQLQKYDVDYGEASLSDEKMDVVNLMSIHKSKGLEFPIVFVVGMGKSFNMQDTRQSIVLHPQLGVGIDAIDPDIRVKAPTLLKKAIQQKVEKESKAEELRVLYVALTRAKEKLILSGASADLERELSRLSFIAERSKKELPYYSLTKAGCYMDWLLPALFRNQCMEELLSRYEVPVPYQNALFTRRVPIAVQCLTVDDLVRAEAVERFSANVTREILEHWNVSKLYDADMKKQIEEQFTYVYPYKDGQLLKQKVSVSELKKSSYAEDAEELYREEEIIPLLPKFLQEEKELSGAFRGSAYHKLLEILDLSAEYDEAGLKREIQKKVQEGKLSGEMAECIRETDILAFLHSPTGERVRRAALRGRCFAEQPFVLGVEAGSIYTGTDSAEYVLIQGIIDLYFEEDDGFVLLDYKTDRVSDERELIDRYQTQLKYYAEALERLTGKGVKEKIIYSFALHREIQISE